MTIQKKSESVRSFDQRLKQSFDEDSTVSEDFSEYKLEDLAKKIRVVVEEAQKDLGKDLGGWSLLDLVADNFPSLPLRTLQDALIVAGYPLKKRIGSTHKQSNDLISAYDVDYWRRNPWTYKDKIDLKQEDFKAIVDEAIALIDPETFSYNKSAARESALELAIWSMENGKYQSKIHPNTFVEMLEHITKKGPQDTKTLLSKKASFSEKKVAKELLEVVNLLLSANNLRT